MITVVATVPQTALIVDLETATVLAANPTPMPLVNVPMLGATIGIPGSRGPMGPQGETGAAPFSVGPLPPSSPAVNDVWIDTN